MGNITTFEFARRISQSTQNHKAQLYYLLRITIIIDSFLCVQRALLSIIYRSLFHCFQIDIHYQFSQTVEYTEDVPFAVNIY